MNTGQDATAALRSLQNAWRSVEQDWSDVKARQFEADVVAPMLRAGEAYLATAEQLVGQISDAMKRL